MVVLLLCFNEQSFKAYTSLINIIYNTYSSFKVFAPKFMKRDLLDRHNWDDSGAIYVREFIPTHASYNKSNY